MDRFRNKYRIASARLQTWNYGWNGTYFITIYTANRELFFGDIVSNEMKLSATGEYHRIKNYTINHPKNWKDDWFNNYDFERSGMIHFIASGFCWKFSFLEAISILE